MYLISSHKTRAESDETDKPLWCKHFVTHLEFLFTPQWPLLFDSRHNFDLSAPPNLHPEVILVKLRSSLTQNTLLLIYKLSCFGSRVLVIISLSVDVDLCLFCPNTSLPSVHIQYSIHWLTTVCYFCRYVNSKIHPFWWAVKVKKVVFLESVWVWSHLDIDFLTVSGLWLSRVHRGVQ